MRSGDLAAAVRPTAGFHPVVATYVAFNGDALKK